MNTSSRFETSTADSFSLFSRFLFGSQLETTSFSDLPTTFSFFDFERELINFCKARRMADDGSDVPASEEEEEDRVVVEEVQERVIKRARKSEVRFFVLLSPSFASCLPSIPVSFLRARSSPFLRFVFVLPLASRLPNVNPVFSSPPPPSQPHLANPSPAPQQQQQPRVVDPSLPTSLPLPPPLRRLSNSPPLDHLDNLKLPLPVQPTPSHLPLVAPRVSTPSCLRERRISVRRARRMEDRSLKS